MKKRPWHLWLVAAFMIFMYAMGVYDIFMMLGYSTAYYEAHNYGQNVVAYFTNYPIPFLVLWIANLISGFLAPIFLIFNAKVAKRLAFISSVADGILLIVTFSFRSRFEVLGAYIAGFDGFILLITVGLYFYCRAMEKRVSVID